MLFIDSPHGLLVIMFFFLFYNLFAENLKNVFKILISLFITIYINQYWYIMMNISVKDN